MKKNLFKIFVAVFFAILISSCAAFHSGIATSSASLDSSNFSYVKQNIKGTATATYILGIGGIGKPTLVDLAKQQMLKSNPLKSNQTTANLTVNFKSTYIFGMFYHTVTCTVTADIVEFK